MNIQVGCVYAEAIGKFHHSPKQKSRKKKIINGKHYVIMKYGSLFILIYLPLISEVLYNSLPVHIYVFASTN